MRQFLGYKRLEHRELHDELNTLITVWSLWQNLFCVTMKPESKRQEESRPIRLHEKKGHTPAQRLIDSGDPRKHEQHKLEKQMAARNPFGVRKEIRISFTINLYGRYVIPAQ